MRVVLGELQKPKGGRKVRKIRFYIEERFPIMPVVAYFIITYGLAFAMIKFPTHSTLLGCILLLIVVATAAFLYLVAYKTDKWWYEEGSKE